MSIAVCSSNEETRNILSELFQRYQQEKSCALTYLFLNSDIDLICDLTDGLCDVIFFSAAQYGSLATEIRERAGSSHPHHRRKPHHRGRRRRVVLPARATQQHVSVPAA